jgi:hypothetical protein
MIPLSKKSKMGDDLSPRNSSKNEILSWPENLQGSVK